MKRLSLTLATAVAGAMLLSSAAALLAQGTAKPAPAQSAPKPKWVAPVKGTAEVGYLAPKTKVVGNEIITTIRIQNLSTGAISLLRVDEFWYDKANNPVGGGTYRHKKLLMPGEVIDVELKIPKNPQMFRNQYQFSHANGQVKAKILKTIEVPKSTT
jgi:hypothetical protein